MPQTLTEESLGSVWFNMPTMRYTAHVGKVGSHTKLVPATPGRDEVTAPYISTDVNTGETTIYYLYETRIINGITEEAEIVGKQDFQDTNTAKRFVNELYKAIEQRESI